MPDEFYFRTWPLQRQVKSPKVCAIKLVFDVPRCCYTRACSVSLPGYTEYRDRRSNRAKMNIYKWNLKKSFSKNNNSKATNRQNFKLPMGKICESLKTCQSISNVVHNVSKINYEEIVWMTEQIWVWLNDDNTRVSNAPQEVCRAKLHMNRGDGFGVNYVFVLFVSLYFVSPRRSLFVWEFSFIKPMIKIGTNRVIL